MNVALVNSSDSSGGAAIACKRLFDALDKSELTVKLLVQEKKSAEKNIVAIDNSYFKEKISYFKFAIEYLFFNKIVKSKRAASAFSPAWLGHDIASCKEIKEADIINLHWINNSFINISSLGKLFKTKKPVVWHLHDMWAFTGGCHQSGVCDHYLNQCGDCYFLKNPKKNDLSSRLWKDKNLAYDNANLTIVTPSKWLAGLAKSSSLFKTYKIYHIPNPIQTNIFKPNSKEESKKKLGLSLEKKYLLFVAMNVSHKFKGFSFLKDAMYILQNNPVMNNVELLVIGSSMEQLRASLPFKTHFLGPIEDEKKMVDIYNASEIFITPSLQDNLPNTVMESLSCGTPVVAFDTGGIPEMVDHLKNGYIGIEQSAEELVRGIIFILASDYSSLSKNARKKVLENYDSEVVAKRYIELFRSLNPNKNY